MNPIFQTLLTMTATASVVALAVMVLRLPLKKAPRWITCCLWVVVFLRMVCPVSFSLPVSLVPASIAQGTYLQIPAAQEPDPSGQTPVQAEVSSPVVAPADTALGQASAPETAQAAPSLSWPAVATGLWLAGSAGMLLWGLVSYLRLKGGWLRRCSSGTTSMKATGLTGPLSAACPSPLYLPTHGRQRPAVRSAPRRGPHPPAGSPGQTPGLAGPVPALVESPAVAGLPAAVAGH